jgi:hypothetical protein
MLLNDRAPDENPFSECSSIAELIVVGDKVVGREVNMMLLEFAKMPRPILQRAERELRHGREGNLADLVKELARAAAPDRRPLWSRSRKPGVWRTPSGQAYVERLRKERRQGLR